MIFKEPHLIPEHKWQTRRPVKPGDKGIGYKGDILCVYRNNRLLWQVGKTYAKQPGRGQKAVGRTPPITKIRREKLRDISEEDCVAEGIPKTRVLKRFAFEQLWNSLYRKPHRWEDDIECWVLEFERAIGKEKEG